MPDSPANTGYRFEVALSFAGPHRDKVRAIAERLSESIDPGLEDRSQGRVFFDEWFQHEILGSDMDVLLQRFYHEQSLMVVADLSEDYADRPWTQAEARAIRSLRMKLDPARDETARLRLLNVRFGPGEVPGVFNTEGWLDGINLSAEEIANVILKRRELLWERLGTNREGEAPAEPQDKSGVPHSNGSAGASPSRVQQTPKGWVWHSSLATRAAGQVSVLAVVETLLAIVLYWWIAIRFETHWHLVTSVFIAPLLLLRSPESMDAGVRWFMKDWFGLGERKNWPLRKRVGWFALIGLVCCCLSYCFATVLSHCWLTGLQGWFLFVWATIIGALFIAVAVTGVGASVILKLDAAIRSGVGASALVALIAGGFFFVNVLAPRIWTDAVAGLSAGIIEGAIVVIAGLFCAIVGAAFTVTVFMLWVSAAVFAPAFGAGVAVRGLFFRVFATLSNLSAGLRSLPANWRENNFLTDFRLPAELMPGIREHDLSFSHDGLRSLMALKEHEDMQYLFRIMGMFFFLPAFLYRLNIKATAWFWWPLAYLLKPAPAASAEGAQRQALCWPWSNPAQRLLIGLSIGLALLSLVLHWLVATSRIESGLVTSLPLTVTVSLGWHWPRLAPWHVALWTIAAAGAGMLMLAGNACSHYANGNWSQYRQRWPQNIRWMTALSRVRRLATISLLVMSLGALLLQDHTWQTYVPVPAGWVTALEEFYSTRGPG
jgi:hypothetical protein